jgi:hypothetical protein
MTRPRWHDALIVAALLLIFLVGVWVVWSADILAWFGITPDAGSGTGAKPAGNV